MPKVLIIEDDPMMQALYTEIFERQEFTVIIAGDGKSGIRQAEHLLPDFILLDVMLPEQDGVTVLKKLKEADLTKDLPVALLTAIPEGPPFTIAPDLREKLVGYWVKDQHTPDDLVEKVKNYLYLHPVKKTT